jgi:hypothetical protein
VRVDAPPPTTRSRQELAEGASPIHAEAALVVPGAAAGGAGR